MLMLPCTSVQLVLCCDQFDHGSRHEKHDPVDLVIVDYDATLWYRIDNHFIS